MWSKIGQPEVFAPGAIMMETTASAVPVIPGHRLDAGFSFIVKTRFYVNMLNMLSTSSIYKDKTSVEMKSLIMRAVRETLSDPDFGLGLDNKVKRRLKKSRLSKNSGMSLAEIKKRYY